MSTTLKIVLAAVAFGLLGSGIVVAGVALSHRHDDEEEAEDDDGPLPALVFPDDAQGLMLTYIDEQGETHDATRPSQVPAASRTLVRVVVAGNRNGTHDTFYVVDLTKKDGKGQYHATTMLRAEWEAEIERRRSESEKTTPPAQARRGRSARPPQEQNTDEVIIYGASWCKPCHKARDYLRSRHVRFTFKDIDETPGAAAELREKLAASGHAGERHIPIIDVRGKILVGFQRPNVDRALAQTSRR